MNRSLLLAFTAVAAGALVLKFTVFKSAPLSQTVIAQAASVEDGEAVYMENCASCHGNNLEGGLGSNLADAQWAYGGTDADIKAVITKGIPDMGMPAYGDTLSDAKQDAVISFIRASTVTKAVSAVTDVESVMDQVQIDTYIAGLEKPWGIQFTARDQGYITEKGGALRIFENGELRDEGVTGLPEVTDKGQGGMLDVAIDPDYANNGWVYLAYSHPRDDNAKFSMTKIVRGKIVSGAWTAEQTLFEAKPEHYIDTGFHFGTRIVFDDAGHLFFSIGDRGKQDLAQDVSVPNGKVHRINRDGSIPADNPFVDQDGAYATIYSYGNRNPQGLAVHPDTGVLWSTEHGPKGGDELNAIQAGVNYGWPVISYGINYNGTELTPYTQMAGMAQPKSHWTPSIAVCGLDVYTGDEFPQWRGRLLAGALKYQEVRLIDVDGENYVSQVSLIKDRGRVRDVTNGPDGAIYVVTDSGDVLRLSAKR